MSGAPVVRGGPRARVRRWLGRAYLAATGWHIEGEVPRAPRYVVIAAPLTSYWDFPHMMAYGFATGQHISFLMKDSMFRGPLGRLLLALGGIPVDRSRRGGLVDSVVRAFEERGELVVVIAPEGTRGSGSHWKSGFYRVAARAQVPIALGYLDYRRRAVGYGPLLHPSGDLRADMDQIRAFYADKRGRYPEHETPPRLAEEEAGPQPPPSPGPGPAGVSSPNSAELR